VALFPVAMHGHDQSGLLQNWLVLCPPEKKEMNDPKKRKKELLEESLGKIALWLPFSTLGDT